ncbi:Aromatic amino acid aminotransferase [Pleurostoma richardsiae]|uniref:Aromatic amino acid aminotransferase n=1 Tax=Pleurostoma richardsiae TaxID=41990 RepID=A0AA38RTM3_9PEZI|nr:Aromatic amino acid aminotransferase [Pleurostoma richardsiae]
MQSWSPAAGSASMAKPKPKDLSHLYSEVTKHRTPSKMKEYYKFFQIPGIGNLSGGLPNVQFFPFDTLEAQTAKPERWTPTPNHRSGDDDLSQKLASTSFSSPLAASHITVPKALNETNPLKEIDLATALQYGLAQGYPPLLSWIRQFTCEHLHPNVPYEGGPDVCLTVGSTDGFSKTLDLFVNSWSEEKDDIRDRPGLLCETFVYGNVLSQAGPRGVQTVPVVADEGGMVTTGPGGLEDVLGNWDESKGRRPHLMYSVTMGHNPTGIVLSLERRKAIYAVCSKYDVVIVEDDPYWYLQFPSAAIEEGKSRSRPAAEAEAEAARQHEPARSSGFDFLDSLTPSFLSVDTDGRVVRLDTFSKTVAPGCRLGWITAAPALVERYVRIAETSTQQPSGFVQSIVAELVMGAQPAEAQASFLSLRTARERAVFNGWKMDGWVRWLEGLRGEYERRMNRMCTILDEGSFQVKQGTPRSAADASWGVITKTQLYDYSWPRGGMFVWIRIFFEEHPLWGVPGSDGRPVDGTALSTALMIFLTTKPYLVLVSPGMMFSATDDIRREIGWAYYRLCFAAESDENIEECSKRFTAGVHKFWRIKDVKDLEKLLESSPVAAAEEAGEELANMGLYMGC